MQKQHVFEKYCKCKGDQYSYWLDCEEHYKKYIMATFSYKLFALKIAISELKSKATFLKINKKEK